MKRTRLCELLEIDHPIIQAGVSWISNPELAAAVSNAGALGAVAPTAGMAVDGDIRVNLREVIRRTKNLTERPFGVVVYLATPEVKDMIDIVIEEGVHVVVTSGGSPALYTGHLKDNGVKVLHLVGSVHHARAAEAQGVDAVVAEGLEGGGLRGRDEIPTFVLVPQVVSAVDIPVIASGGIADARGLVAALALGAAGVYVGTRFIVTPECIAHIRYKEAILKAIDTTTVVAGRYYLPTRVLKTMTVSKLEKNQRPMDGPGAAAWEASYGVAQSRAALLEGDLDSAVAYCGASAGLITEVMGAAEVVHQMTQGADALLAKLK